MFGSFGIQYLLFLCLIHIIMDLDLRRCYIVVCGAGSGLGYATALGLAREGAKVLAVARTKEKIEILADSYPNNIELFPGDLFKPDFIDNLIGYVADKRVDGIMVNAAGPAALQALKTTIAHWDEAYRTLVRWKIQLIDPIVRKMTSAGYGRILFLESISVKQPVENLVLSNSLRLAVVGYAKTLSQEVAGKGVTVNVIAPGYHDTAAMQRLIDKKSASMMISHHEARQFFENQPPVNRMGKPDEFATLACWLLSPLSGYITGQTLSVDGGLVKHVFG